MATQYRPYGDVVAVNTPTLDNLAKQLYVQQQQRQVRQQQENQALDQMIQKDFGRIRSVDTPEVVQKYNQYKELKKQLYFNKQLQRNPLLYNEVQQKANSAYQDMQSTINGSAEMKEFNKSINSAQLKNPDAFSDEYGQMMATQMNTPFSQLRNHPVFGDLTNADNYRYKGANTNFNDIVNKVYGQPHKIVGQEEPLDNKGIQFRSPVYEYGNSPSQVYEGLVNSLDHKTERDAAYKWKQLTPDVVQKIEQDYNAIPKSKWEQMGLTGLQKIDLRGGSDAEKYMRVLAMQNAINTQPRLTGYQNRTSELAKKNYDFVLDKVMEGIKFGHQKELKKTDQDAADSWIEGFWQQRLAGAANKEEKPIFEPNKLYAPTFAKELDPDPVMMKALARNGVEPNQVFLTKDNKVWPIFWQYQEDHDANGKKIGVSLKKDKLGEPEIDWDVSRKMDMDQAYLAMGYKGQTKKQLSGTMGGQYNKKEEKKQATSTSDWRSRAKKIE